MNLSALSLQTLVGLTGISLLLSTATFQLLIFFKVKKQSSYIISSLFFVLSFVSFSGNSINFYFRGLFNDLSITTLILLVYYFIPIKKNERQTRPLLLVIAITGLFFYPAALGLGSIDPYSWGFISNDHGLLPPLIFLSLLGGLMYFAWLKNYNLLLFSLVLATLAHQSGLLESRNFWDYLLDPVIFIYALLTIIRSLLGNKK